MLLWGVCMHEYVPMQAVFVVYPELWSTQVTLISCKNCEMAVWTTAAVDKMLKATACHLNRLRDETACAQGLTYSYASHHSFSVQFRQACCACLELYASVNMIYVGVFRLKWAATCVWSELQPVWSVTWASVAHVQNITSACMCHLCMHLSPLHACVTPACMCHLCMQVSPLLPPSANLLITVIKWSCAL